MNSNKFSLTVAPYNFTSADIAITVNEVVITPVKIAMITRPVKIQTTANKRPGTPTGAISPYLKRRKIDNENLYNQTIKLQ